MQIIKWEPFREIDRLLDDRFLQSRINYAKLGFDFAVDVYQEKDNLIAKMSLPGMKSEDIDITIEDQILTISGKKEEEKETEHKNYYSKEIRTGSFSRSINLPKPVDVLKTEAKCENGELLVTMPVVAGAKEKAIKIKIKK